MKKSGNLHTYARTHIHTFTNLLARTYAHVILHTHVHTHTHTQICVCVHIFIFLVLSIEATYLKAEMIQDQFEILD